MSSFFDKSFSAKYEAWAFKSETGGISLQPLQATIPHMKANQVPYQLMHSAQSTPKGYTVSDQNEEGICQTPAGHQNMTIKYLSVGQWSWFLYQQVALNALSQIRYDGLPNSY